MQKRLRDMLILYIRWARAGQTWWARWHVYAGLVMVYALICLATAKLELM